MNVVYLADHTEWLPTLAGWLHAEWYAALDLTCTHAADTLRDRLRRDRLPLTLVALAGAEAAGMVSLIHDETPDGDTATAFLAGLFVAPERRRQGLGGLLCRRALAEAQRLGLPRLCLYTSNLEMYYAGLGWSKVIERVIRAGDLLEVTTFMERDLSL